MQEAGPSLARRAVAVVVLGLAAYVLFKVVLHIVVALAWFLAVIVAIVAVVWAVRTL